MKKKLLEGLSEEKIKLIKKYSLSLNDDLIWEFNHSKYHTVKYFSHKFALKESTLALLFYIHRLCFAKIKYFEANFDKYVPYRYDFKLEFIKCDLYDMEFMLHKPSGLMIDLRNLQKIKNIEEFRKFCDYLESFE